MYARLNYTIYQHPDKPDLYIYPFNTMVEAANYFKEHGHYLRPAPAPLLTEQYPKIIQGTNIVPRNLARGRNWYKVEEEYRRVLPLSPRTKEPQKQWPCDFEGKNKDIPPIELLATWPDGSYDLVQTAIAYNTSLERLHVKYSKVPNTAKLRKEVLEFKTKTKLENYVRKYKVIYAIYCEVCKNPMPYEHFVQQLMDINAEERRTASESTEPQN